MAAEDQMEGSMALSDTVTQLQELYSFKNDKMPKARKPYTISKQREKWTEEEHQKFLEAIKLYGRGWRQIEEHVGTKTAVQIRSHAQKFFSKVVREPNDISEVSIKPTEIPPPRPKRKPMHPYPRKCVDSSKVLLLAMKPEGSLSPSELVGEQENKSPATVLAAFTSDVLGSPVSEQEHGCSSPTSCTTYIQSMNVSFAEKDSEYATSKSSTEEEKASLEDFLLMNCKDSIRVEQGAKEILRSNSIKLFGRTVVVRDTEKPHVLGAGSLDANDELPFQTLKSKKLDTQLSLGSISSGDALNPDTEKPDLIKPTPQAPSPQCPLYQTLPFYYLTSFKPTIAHTSIDACVSERNKEKETLDEQSCSGSNAGSVSQTENKEKSSDVADSQFRQPCYEEKDSLWKSAAKGFVPYKRCLAERDVSSSMAVFEEQKRQRTRVCS